MNNAIVTRTYIAGYHISDEDDLNDIKYYGYLGYNNTWMIERWDTLNKTHRFVQGTSDYPTAWTNRASQSYRYFNEVYTT